MNGGAYAETLAIVMNQIESLRANISIAGMTPQHLDHMEKVQEALRPLILAYRPTARFEHYTDGSPNHKPVAEYMVLTLDGQYPHGSVMCAKSLEDRMIEVPETPTYEAWQKSINIKEWL